MRGRPELFLEKMRQKDLKDRKMMTWHIFLSGNLSGPFCRH
jgi:hypothetical protein